MHAWYSPTLQALKSNINIRTLRVDKPLGDRLQKAFFDPGLIPTVHRRLLHLRRYRPTKPVCHALLEGRLPDADA